MITDLDSSPQLVFVDLLFLGLAAGMAFWFRAWLREQKGEMDRRLEVLETQQQSLVRVCERLCSACRTLERQASPPGRGPPGAMAVDPAPGGERVPASSSSAAPRTAARVPSVPGPRTEAPASRPDRRWEELSDRSREAYRKARDLLDQGMSSAEIARRVGLGVAEVNVLRRMRSAGRR